MIRKTASSATSEAPSSPQGTQAARRPLRSESVVGVRVAGGGAVMVMSVRSREFLAAVDYPPRHCVDQEGHDEQDEAGRDEDVDVRAERLRECEGDVRGDRRGVGRGEQLEGDG